MNTTNDTDDPCNLQLSHASRALYGSALLTFAILGTIGNSVLSFYVIRHTEMRSLINILLATMAVSDTLISALCTPFDFLTIVKGTWFFGGSTCLIHSFLLSVLVVENVTMLVIISIDRYCIVVQKKDFLRGCHVAALLSACSVFSVLVSVPPLFESGRLIFANGFCRQICEAIDEDYIYSILYSSLLFVLPCGLLLLAYVHIIVIIRKRSRSIRPQCNHRVSVNSVYKVHRIHVKFKQDTFATILYLYAAAMVCKLPLAISIFVQGLSTYKVCPLGHWIMLLTYSNSALNPFIYAYRINEYWMMLTGKFHNVKDHVKNFKSKSLKRDQPHAIYMVTFDSSG